MLNSFFCSIEIYCENNGNLIKIFIAKDIKKSLENEYLNLD